MTQILAYRPSPILRGTEAEVGQITQYSLIAQSDGIKTSTSNGIRSDREPIAVDHHSNAPSDPPQKRAGVRTLVGVHCLQLVGPYSQEAAVYKPVEAQTGPRSLD